MTGSKGVGQVWEGRLLGRGEGAGPRRGRVDNLWEPLKNRGSGTRREKAVKTQKSPESLEVRVGEA